jgi:hypothetical protein
MAQDPSRGLRRIEVTILGFINVDPAEMDASAVVEVIKGNDAVAWAVLIGLVIPTVAKGAFAVRGGLHQRRKDFLDLWMRRDHRVDALCLEGMVTHLYGGDLSASFIRHVISLEHPFDKLKRASLASDFLTLDAVHGLVTWKKGRRAHAAWFWLECLSAGVAYMLLITAGILGCYLGAESPQVDFVLVFYSGVALLMGCLTFWHLIALTEARSTLRILTDAGVATQFAQQAQNSQFVARCNRSELG